MRRPSLVVVFFTVFLDLLGFGLVLPLLGKYGPEAYGATAGQIGWLVAAYSAMQFVFSPLWGRLSDRIGRRPVLMFSIAGSVVSYLIFAFAPSLTWLFVSRLLAGAMAANISAAQAYVADVTAPEDRAKGMGLVGAAVGLGFVLGPLLAVPAGGWGQRGIGLTAAALSFADLLLAAAILRESLPPERRATPARREPRLRAMAKALATPGVGPPILVFFLSTLAFAGLEATLTLFLTDRVGGGRPLSEAQIGGYLGFIGVIVVLVQGGLAGRLAKRAGEVRLVLAGCVLLAGGFGMLSWASGLGAVLVSLALVGLGHGINSPALNSLISRNVSAADQGSTLGVNQGFASLARVLGPAAGGRLFEFGPAYPYVLAAVLMVVAFLLALRVAAALRSQSSTVSAPS